VWDKAKMKKKKRKNQKYRNLAIISEILPKRNMERLRAKIS
jgi:hypothetical protein